MGSTAMPDTVVRFKVAVTRADTSNVANKDKAEKMLGPATVVRPALFGAGILFVVQGAMKLFLHA